MAAKPRHFQDGERCGLCFESWPCEGRRTGLSGIQQWKLQTELVQSQEMIRTERQQREELVRLIKEGCDLLGLDLGHSFDPGFAGNGYMIRIEDLAFLITLAINNMEVRSE